MKTAGTLDTTAAAALPPVTGTPVVPSKADSDTATAYLAKEWANAVG
jgi:putative spermidine/putrescine transport system substrate-binding protein